MKAVAPMVGFVGEKDFNPFYMIMQVVDKYPIIPINENLCWVEYQLGKDSMSQGIYKQYVRSPKSYAKYRLMQLSLKHGMTLKNKLKLYLQYDSSCFLAKDFFMIFNAPNKFLAFLLIPFAVALSIFIYIKSL